MKVGKRTNLYAVAGVLTTGTGNKVVAGKSSMTRPLRVVDSLQSEDFAARPALPVSAYGDVGDVGSVDWSQLWPYGGDAA